MQPNSQERRMMRRFDMRLPAIVRLEGANEFHTETQNVSARGVFFLSRPRQSPRAPNSKSPSPSLRTSP